MSESAAQKASQWNDVGSTDLVASSPRGSDRSASAMKT